MEAIVPARSNLVLICCWRHRDNLYQDRSDVVTQILPFVGAVTLDRLVLAFCKFIYCYILQILLYQYDDVYCKSWYAGHNGTINGQGQIWWKRYRQKLLNHTRGPLIQIMWSSDIVISNVTLQDSPFWTFHPYDCKNVTVKNVTILNPIFEAPNTDGIDPGKALSVHF